MMYQYLTSGQDYQTTNDVAEFEKRFPSAVAWLMARDLQREWECLKAELARHQEFCRRWTEKCGGLPFPDPRAEWVEKRVAELDEHFAQPHIKATLVA